MFSFFKKKKVLQVPEFPTEIIVEQVTPQDGEILEEWSRICHQRHKQFHAIDVIKIDDGEFPWYLYFSAGEFIREEPFVNELSRVIYEAIERVEGVKDVFHEDTEKFVIAGENISPKELIYQVSTVIDKFMRENLHKWDVL